MAGDHKNKKQYNLQILHSSVLKPTQFDSLTIGYLYTICHKNMASTQCNINCASPLLFVWVSNDKQGIIIHLKIC